MIATLLLCAAARVVDGDTIYCSGVGRVRLVAIDAPDKTTSKPCREHYGNHVCNDADADMATAYLQSWILKHRVSFRQVGYDFRNKRTVGQFFAGRRDLQCNMLQFAAVRYFTSYDRKAGYPIKRRCPTLVRFATHAD